MFMFCVTLLTDAITVVVDSRSWSQPMQLNVSGPTPRAAHTLCATGHTLVVFGGRDPIGRQNDLYFFDTGICDFHFENQGKVVELFCAVIKKIIINSFFILIKQFKCI